MINHLPRTCRSPGCTTPPATNSTRCDRHGITSHPTGTGAGPPGARSPGTRRVLAIFLDARINAGFSRKDHDG